MHQFLFYNEFIIKLYMFRAQLCPSSGGKNCITASGTITLCRRPSDAQVGRALQCVYLKGLYNRPTNYECKGNDVEVV